MKKILYLLLCLMFLSQNFLSVPIIHAGSYTKAPAKDGIWDAGGYWMDEPENFVGFSGDAEYGVEKSAIQFNLTDINEAVSKATLRFYVTEIQDLNLADSAVPIVKVYGSSINSWGASFPKNPGDPLLNPTDTGVTKGQWKELEVTGFVQTRMSADKVVTFALVGEEVVPGVQFMFASDNFPFTSLRPQLVLSTGTVDITSVTSPSAKTGLPNGTAKNATALGLPSQVEVTLSDSSKTNVDVSWDVVSTTYNPATKTAQTFTVTGTLTNLPSNVTNTTNKTASISVTVDAEPTKDILSVKNPTAITGLANGTTKTVAALGLPAEVEVTLDDSSKINVDVSWDVASTTYNPATKTAQTFTVTGTLTNLPSNVTNTTNKTASISVTVDAEVVATKDITAVAS
ncbi:Ig-like domain-containing protein, partial [Brevibacillus sp. SYSU BS000544]|uniref:Ig-like domain-containing protein n=1 Tax=Brevibacillus sp. SYSU BS000544 TaxID=3416443 RepID=UPI003CE54FCF